MASFQDTLDNLGKIIGGTVDPVFTHYFSGAKANDGTGLSPAAKGGLNGCWSSPPETLAAATLPVAVIFPGPFTLNNFLVQGKDEQIDRVKLFIFVSRSDSYTQIPKTAVFRDSVPTILAANLQLTASANVLQAWPEGGDYHPVTYGTDTFYAIEFNVAIYRYITRTFTA